MARRLSHHRRVATAALLLCFVVATMLVSVVLSRGEGPRGGRTDLDPSGGVGATTHQVGSLADWEAAVAVAAPGDVITLTSTINARLLYRGDNDGSTGTGGDGTAEAPIVITAAPGVWIDPGNRNNGHGALDVVAADHVHVVGVRVRNAQFGIRCLQCRGVASAPVRISGNTVTDIGHAGIHFGGHWATHDASRFGLIDGNTVTFTGLSAARYGEGIYLGYGSEEWVDETSDVVVSNNDISRTGAEGIDVKPGTRNITVTGNRIHDLAPIDGGAISAHYVNHTPNPNPHQSGNVRIEGNMIWNVNLDGVPGSNDWAIWVGHGGVDVVGNRIWGLRNDPAKTRAVRIRATQSFGPHPIRIQDNTFWTARGWVAELTPSGAGNVAASGNRGLEAGSAEIVVGPDAFVGPVPPLGAASTADNGGGPGSALAMAGGALPPDLTSASTTTSVPAFAPAPNIAGSSPTVPVSGGTPPEEPATSGDTSGPPPVGTVAGSGSSTPAAPVEAPSPDHDSFAATTGTDSVLTDADSNPSDSNPSDSTTTTAGTATDPAVVTGAEIATDGPETLAFAGAPQLAPRRDGRGLAPFQDPGPTSHRLPATAGGIAMVATLLAVAGLLAVRAARAPVVPALEHGRGYEPGPGRRRSPSS